MFQQIAPYIGYVASLFLIVSLIVHGDLKFRLYNSLGCVAFIIYGIAFNAWPVILTNALLLAINIYYLNKFYKHQENFELIEFAADDKLITTFLKFYETDIATYFPDFAATQLQGNFNFIVLRDLVIANIFSAHIAENGDATVAINYTTKKYRDFKVGKFIFEKEKQHLISKHVKRIVYKIVNNKNHATFLKMYGFIKDGETYFKKID
jgi:presenilin-like A22 family membrane protease